MKALPLSPDFGLLLARLMTGVVGVHHGAQKLFGAFGGPGLTKTAEFLEQMNVPMPKVSAVLAGSAECFGGALIAIGLFPRIAAVFFAFTMFVAYFKGHKGVFPAQDGGGEYALTLAVFATALILTGPGRWTVMKFLPARPSPSKGG